MRAVLTYHSVDPSGSPISTDPAVFEEHTRWLSSGRVRVAPLDQVLSTPPRDGEHEVAITFDDAVANTETPIRRLLDAGVPVSVFVVTGRVGQTNVWGQAPDAGIPVLPLLSWDRLAALAEAGVSLGAHTRSHARLPRLAAETAAAEMDGSVTDLRARLGVEARHFAYPYGATSPVVRALAADRFAAALTAEFATLGDDTAPEAVPRLDMYYFRQPGAIARLGAPNLGARIRWIQLRRRVRRLWA
jgi:peptidoglycan/xylan/chitin deacetylase (PgdA/CDA1 family)